MKRIPGYGILLSTQVNRRNRHGLAGTALAGNDGCPENLHLTRLPRDATSRRTSTGRSAGPGSRRCSGPRRGPDHGLAASPRRVTRRVAGRRLGRGVSITGWRRKRSCRASSRTSRTPAVAARARVRGSGSTWTGSAVAGGSAGGYLTLMAGFGGAHGREPSFRSTATATSRRRGTAGRTPSTGSSRWSRGRKRRRPWEPGR